jgi:small subunit ribosomal protein S21
VAVAADIVEGAETGVAVAAAAVIAGVVKICVRTQQLFNNKRERESYLIEIKLRRGEPVDKGLRRLKKQMLREGVIKELKKRRHYEKPSIMLRRKMKVARFDAMLKQRHADD